MHLEPAWRGAGDSYFDTTYDFGVVLSRDGTTDAVCVGVCACVLCVDQVHGQVWSSCQTERLGILGAGNAHVCGPRCGTLLPRSASRLAPALAGPAAVTLSTT